MFLVLIFSILETSFRFPLLLRVVLDFYKNTATNIYIYI